MSSPLRSPARSQRDEASPSGSHSEPEEMNKALLENPKAESSTSRSESFRRRFDVMEVEAAVAKKIWEASSRGDESISSSPQDFGSVPENDLEKAKKLLLSCREGAMSASSDMKKCIGEKQQMRSRFDDLFKDKGELMEDYKELETKVRTLRESFEDMVFRNGSLELKVQKLEKKNEELRANYLKSKQKVNVLIEEKRILDEEKQRLQRQIWRDGC